MTMHHTPTELRHLAAQARIDAARAEQAVQNAHAALVAIRSASVDARQGGVRVPSVAREHTAAWWNWHAAQQAHEGHLALDAAYRVLADHLDGQPSTPTPPPPTDATGIIADNTGIDDGDALAIHAAYAARDAWQMAYYAVVGVAGTDVAAMEAVLKRARLQAKTIGAAAIAPSWCRAQRAAAHAALAAAVLDRTMEITHKGSQP